MAAKNKAAVKVTKKISSISMSINGAEFYAEGDSAEVSAKLSKWLEETLAPMRAVRELAEKNFKP